MATIISGKQYGGERKALKAASDALAELKELLDSSSLVNGKLIQDHHQQGKEAVGFTLGHFCPVRVET